jgi:PAS domain S-box-containing protein
VDDLNREIQRLRAELYEYRRAQESLRDTEQRLRAVIEHAPIVVFATDRDGVFTLSEGRGLDSLGLKSGQVVGMSAFEIYRDFPQIVSNLRACLAGKALNDVVRVGELVFESLYIPRRDERGEVIGVSGVAWEVTQRVQAEEAARMLEAQLLQAQKMETIGTLAGGIAHDFNNILSPILGYADIALSQLPAAHPVRDDIDQILKAARRAKDLVEQILIFSRRGDEVKRPLQLHLVILEALKLIRSSLPSTIEISQRIETRNDTVLADPAQMHQVIMNLCTNAAHAMRNGGGVLRIELGHQTLDAAAAEKIGNLKPGGYVVLTVRDQGEGMDEATRQRVFEPFFTTKKPGEGTGLGLSVVHGIVHSHGGAITVDSRPGEGATFRAYFPSAPGSETTAREDEPVEPGRGREHILVVDDEPEIASMLSRMLETRGYRVSTFTSGPEAMAAFRRTPETFDAIISDQTMPRLSGLELAREAHALRPAVPVILTTGYRDRIRSEEFKREIADVATKPFEAAALLRTLRGVLDRQ